MKKIIRTLVLIFALTAGLALFIACEKEQQKIKLENPIVAAQVYTGSKLTADVPQNDGYRIVSNEGGTDAGEYDIVLELTDATKYEWATPDGDDATKATLKFVVTKATNRITALSLESWTYGEEAKIPVAEVQFGTPTFTYSAIADGTFTEIVPTAVGNYVVKATVAATTNYDGAEKTAEFKIDRANAAFTTVPAAVENLVYTGGALDLITAGIADGGTMQYKLGDNGTWSSDIPTATNAGEYTVYYKALGDDNHKDIAEANVTVGIAKAASTFGKLPQALDLSYTGAVQALLRAGETTCGEIWYKLDNGEWTNEIPTATEAKTYYVCYKIIGDNNHNDLTDIETQKISVTIKNADAQVTAPTAKTGLSYNGEEQVLVDEGSAVGATISYKLGDGDWTTDIPSATDAGEYTVAWKAVADANYAVDETEKRLTITIARVADSIDFSLDNVTVRCGDPVPELTATSTSGTAVTFTYSDNGNDYYTKDQFSEFTFTYGTTYYVKATVADSTNYTGTEKVLTIIPQHNISISENDGVQTAVCQCGKKDVTGTLGTKQTIDFAATADGGQVKATDGKLDLTTIGYSGNAEVTLTVGETDYKATAQNGVVGLADVLPLGVYGEKEFGVSVTDEKETYNVTVKALVVTMTITTADQYANWIKIADACETEDKILGGYFKLGANITVETMVTFERHDVDGLYGFKGVFDGCGYALDGLTATGNAFISCMTKDGVLRNIAFTNAKVAGASNFLCSGGLGTIENVYVQYVSISAGSNDNGTIYNHCRNEQEGGKITGIFVDASQAALSGTGASFRLIGGNNTGYNGIFAVCPENYAPAQAIDRVNNYEAVAYFTSFDELKVNTKTQGVLEGWKNNGFWTVNDGIPAPENYVVNNIAFGAKVIDLDIIVADNGDVRLNDNALEIDCTTAGFTFGNVVSVTMDGVAINAGGFTFAGGKLSVARSAFGYNYGAKQIVVTDDDGKTITIAATLVSKVLKNSTDYANWIKIANACETENQILGGYFKLGANITVETMVTFERYDVDGLYGFKGVFDGCGYALDGLTATGNAFISCMTKDGVLRNIAFTNAKVAGASNFLCSGGLGTIENVYVQYVSISAGSNDNGTIYNHCRNEQEGGKITGIFVDASQAALSGTGASFRLIGGNNTGYNGIFAVCPENYAPAQAIDRVNNYEAVAYFTSFDELKVNTKTQGVLKGWNSTYWTIVDGVPVFATK
mgnify:FL=1